MREQEFRELCAKRGLSQERVEAEVSAVRDFEADLAARGLSLADAGEGALREYLSRLIEKGLNSEARLVGLARYSHMTGNYARYTYVLGIISGRGVLPNLAARTGRVAGEAVRSEVFSETELPPLGSPQDAYPRVVERVVRALEARLPEATCQDILAGNHHAIPVEAFAEDREVYLRSGLDELLRFRRERLLSQLEDHARSGEPWYEQEITWEVVDYVRSNPEIQAGARIGDSIFVSKIPYAPGAYLEATEPRWKRYYLCHCPLARASIINESPPVPPLFCYCSGGFTKLAFDVAFGRSTRVKVLESALAGDVRCRFEIAIPEEAR